MNQPKVTVCGILYGKYQETKRNASIELTKKVNAILLYWGGLRGMTSDHLLSALSIATPFNLHLQAIRICGRCIITDHRLVSVGSPVRRSGADHNVIAVALHIRGFIMPRPAI